MQWNALLRIVTAAAALGLAVSTGGHPAAAAFPVNVTAAGGAPTASVGQDHSLAASLPTTTPIKHLVVLFQENASFDHYCRTGTEIGNYTGARYSVTMPAM